MGNTSNSRMGQIGWLTLAVVGLGLLLWFARSGEQVEQPRQGLESDGSLATGAVGAQQAELVSVPLAEDSGEIRTVVVEKRAVSPVRKVTLHSKPACSEVRWIEGVVELAEGTPADERLEITASGKKFKGLGDRRKHRVPVGADGRFRVAVAEATKTVRFTLLGRYNYINKEVKWKVAGGKDLVLQPKLGSLAVLKIQQDPASSNPIPGFRAKAEFLLHTLDDRALHLDANGRLELGGLNPGSWVTIHMVADDCGPQAVVVKGTVPGEREERTVVLGQGVRVSGRIVDQHGVGVADGAILGSVSTEFGSSRVQFPVARDAMVKIGASQVSMSRIIPSNIKNGHFAAWSMRIRVTSGRKKELKLTRDQIEVQSNGQFGIQEMAAGKYNIELRFDGMRGLAHPESRNFEVFPGQTTTLNFGPAADGCIRLSGRLFSDGRGVSGRTLTFDGTEPGRDPIACRTLAGGKYSITLAGGGVYSVRCSGAPNRGEIQWTETIEGAGAQVLDMSIPEGDLTLKIVTKDGSNLSGWGEEYTCYLRHAQHDRGLVIPKEYRAGEVIFGSLAPGTYWIDWRTPLQFGLHVRDLDWVVLSARQQSIDYSGERKTVTVLVGPPSTLRGQVSGIPVGQSAEVRITRPGTPPNPLSEVRVRKGAFSVDRLPEGEVWAQCMNSEGQLSDPVSVTLHSGEESQVNLTYPEEWR